MDVLSPGCCIDIKHYLEQIWISISKDAKHGVDITEVYDLCIYNCIGSPPLKDLWLLFPHDYTIKEGDKHTATIKVLPMTPAVCKQDPKYEWAYDTPPKRSKGSFITRSFYDEPPSLGGKKHVTHKGKILVSEDKDVGFPADLGPEHLEILARTTVKKTVLCATLEEPLHEGEQGWIRVIAKPQRLDAVEPKRKLFPKTTDLFVCEYRMVIQCPIIVRQMLDLRLDSSSLKDLYNQCEHIRNVVFSNGVYCKDTSTRITNHRLALIATEDFDICDSNCAGSMECLGRIPPLEEQGHTAILWHGGSNSNRQFDLLHNARRIIDMVHHTGPKTKNHLALALSPSGKHEAFCVLIDKMVEVKLLKITAAQDEPLALPDNFDRDNPFSDYRMTKLRRVYSADSTEKQVGLLQEFTDLHPFRIDFTLKWFDT